MGNILFRERVNRCVRRLDDASNARSITNVAAIAMIFDFLKLRSIPVSRFFLLASFVVHPIGDPCFVEILRTIEVR